MHVAGPKERHYESLIQRLLSQSIAVAQHPRTCIQVVLQVCRQGGSELSAGINAATAALLDACVPLKSTLVAACIAASTEGELLVDPTSVEETVRAQSLPLCRQNVHQSRTHHRAF
jgi:exosome complex component RRP46